MNCFGCAVAKDPLVNELYPFVEGGIVTDEPIAPLFVLDCQGSTNRAEYRVVVVCHACFHRLAPDTWISEACWLKLNPTIPFARLPLLSESVPEEQRWNPSFYEPLP